MKALIFEGVREVAYKEYAEPEVPPSWSRLRVEAAGICGSDMRGYHGTDKSRVPPLVMGHEIAAVVVDGPLRGRHVVVNPMITCGTCRECVTGRPNLCRNRYAIGVQKPGGFAEFVAVPDRNVIPLPKGMDLMRAVLAEPAATCLRCVMIGGRLLHRPIPEAKALVIGGGAIGILSALWLRNYGARSVVLSETNPLRRATAAVTGIETIDPATAKAGDDGFDLIIDAVGCGITRQFAMTAVARGGVIVHVGLMDSAGSFDMRKHTIDEIILAGSYTYLPEDLIVSIRALHEGVLGSLDWVEERALGEGPAAFAALSQGSSAAPKIVLRPAV